jgi:hypothetical protein
LNAFETIDKGLVYIDSTGREPASTLSSQSPDPISENDSVAYILIDKSLGFFPLAYGTSPEYSFYENYSVKRIKYLWKS